MNPYINKNQLERCCNLIATQTGIIIRVDEKNALHEYMHAKLSSTSFSNMDAFCRFMESDSPESRLEWKKLISCITIGESYFFRDKGQFSLLENKIFPELLELKKREHCLSVWSAGCSTGEEPYSIAILLDRLIGNDKSWKINIIGTDINEDSIKKAGHGRFGKWSFRRIDQEIKDNYFKDINDQWEIIPSIRNMVVFRTMNLNKDKFPDHGTDLNNLDLIICRNLFIYFSRPAVSDVLKKLTGTLSQGGYLMTGHGELHDQNLGSLVPIIFPESVIYRKDFRPSVTQPHSVPAFVTKPDKFSTLTQKSPTPRPNPEKRILNATHSTSHADIDGMIKEIKSVSKSGDLKWVIEKAEILLNIDKYNSEGRFLMARAYAGLGLYDDAISHLKQLLDKDSLHTDAYLLLAQISEIRGDNEGAKNILKKVIYIDPDSIAAHLELGALYKKEKDEVRAVKMTSTALHLIKKLPPKTVIEIYDGISAIELEGFVKKMLEAENIAI